MGFYAAQLAIDDHDNAMQSLNIKWWPTFDGKCQNKGISCSIFYIKKMDREKVKTISMLGELVK
jgi:hypothetical protein